MYPADLPARAWLGYYASHFDTVELNAAFYRLPSTAAYDGWRAQVARDFCFAVKASRYLTHMKKLTQPRDPIRRMLLRARRLGPTLGPEVRHASWFEDPVVDRLRAGNVALCFHDWREQPVTGPVTADFVYVRRHGTSPKRYHGSYTAAMLRADAARIRSWRRAGLDVYVYFNNDFHGHAWRNARTLKILVGML